MSIIAISAVDAWAADLPARIYTKAPPPVVAAVSWTGCYIGGGGGYGLWNQENTGFVDPPNVEVRRPLTGPVTTGGRGWFGTVQGGCDYQFGLGGAQFVVGAFGDYDFAEMTGRKASPVTVLNSVGDEKLSSQWAVGGRIGWLVTPSLLTYFVGGYTEAKFDRINYTNLSGPVLGLPQPWHTDGHTYKGWFLGAGDEYALSFLPGLFWKTEYRFSRFDTQTNDYRDNVTNLSIGNSDESRKWVHTVRSELVYRFNWGGPVVAKY